MTGGDLSLGREYSHALGHLGRRILLPAAIVEPLSVSL